MDKKRSDFPGADIFSKKYIVISIIVFWISLGLFYYFLPVLESMMTHSPVQWGLNLIFSTGWIIWACLTPLMIWFARKFSVLKGKIFRNILLHLSIATGLVLIELFIEFSLQNFLSSRIYNFPRDINNFFYMVVYKFHTYIVIYFLVVFSVQAVQYFRDYRAALQEKADIQTQLLSAQLNTLKAQLQPHFLFNTHNTILSLILKNENEKAAKMLTKLSELFRATLDVGDEEFNSFEKELKLIAAYLSIHETRFEDRLTIRYYVSAEADAALVPSFILQPLVENAIIHGIAPFKETGLIEISAYVKDEFLNIEVRDDGKKTIAPYKEGIGLKNTIARLKALFDDRFYFELKKHPVKGAVSYLRFPLIPPVS
jgi:sensor histidine kinase YesM